MSLELVFLFYGLSFLSVGIVIIAQSLKGSKFELALTLRLLAMFGFIHGALEWVDMWSLNHVPFAWINEIKLVLLFSSMLFLFEFGRTLLRTIVPFPVFVLSRYIYFILGFIIVLVPVLFEDNINLELQNWTRYLLGFPGGIMSGVGLHFYFKEKVQSTLEGKNIKQLKVAFYSLSMAFVLYGFFAGLIVLPGESFPSDSLNTESFLVWTGIPVQVFRTLCAVVIAFALVRVVKLFAIEQANENAIKNQIIEDLYTRYSLIMSSTLDGICFINKLGLIQFINKSGAQMLGYMEKDLIDQNFHFRIHYAHEDGTPYSEEDCETFKVLHNMEGSTKIVRDVFWTKSNQALPVEFISSPTIVNGVVEGAVIVFRDQTEKKGYENSLMVAKIKAESANIAKTQFLTNMSHEFRTPLNAIIGFSDLLVASDLNQEQKKSAEIIVKAGETLLNIVNDVLDYSKLEEDRIELNPLPFRWSELIDKLSRFHSMSAVQKKVKLLFNIGPKVPPECVGDIQRIEQVFMNLISNAIKFTNFGMVSVNIDALRLDGNECVIKTSIVDTGVGISSEDQEKIFQRFYQVDGSMTRKYSGTGLGLAIVKKILEKMQGEIQLQSQVDQGSTFTFTIRLGMMDRSSKG